MTPFSISKGFVIGLVESDPTEGSGGSIADDPDSPVEFPFAVEPEPGVLDVGQPSGEEAVPGGTVTVFDDVEGSGKFFFNDTT